MKLRHKGPWIIVVAAGVIFGVADTVCYRSQRQLIQKCKDERIQNVITEVRSGLRSQARQAAASAELVASFPTVQAALKGGDRDRLMQETAPAFKEISAKYDLEQATFVSNTMSAVLRLHNPTSFGDDLSAREMIARADHGHATQSGTEVGKSGVSIRSVTPVVDGQDVVGLFEWGIGFSRLLQRVKENTHAELAVYVDEKWVPKTQGDLEDEHVSGYRALAATDGTVIKHIVSQDLLGSVQDARTLFATVGDTEWGLALVPLEDFGGRQIGVIIGVLDMSDFHHDHRATLVNFLLTLAIGLILLAGAAQVAFNALVIRPLNEVGERAAALAKGELGQPIELAKRKDELGGVGKNLEQLREKLAQAESKR